jgi:ABC-type phosphate transport system substrate-binding protein
MEKKIMYISVAVIAILLIAGIGAVVLLSNNNNNSNSSANVKILLIKTTDNSTAYSPLDEAAVLEHVNNTKAGGYDLARYLYLYTNGIPTGASWSWIHWILTTGQSDVENAGFYSLPANTQTAMLNLLGSGPGSSNGTIVESGSTTMEQMANLWQNDSKATYPGISVSLNFPGSGPGIQALMDGKCDIAQASRAMTATEEANITAHGGSVYEFKVAVDGISLIVNPDNNITTLSIPQLAKIYNGTYTNWDQVGGKNEAITLYGRDSSSGTAAYFDSAVLGGTNVPSASMQQFTSNAPIVQQVLDNKGSIGYVGIGYAKGG